MPEKPTEGPIIIPNLAQKIERAVQKIMALGGDKIRFIILYGSANDGCMKEDSDIDISVYYDDADASEFRLKVLSDLFLMSMISRSSSSFRFLYAAGF
jgi:predicted nucleotidyltransferase